MQQQQQEADQDDDRDDPFDSDVTSEEDEDDDLAPERETQDENPAAEVDVIQQELDAREAEADRLVEEELRRSDKAEQAAAQEESKAPVQAADDDMHLEDETNIAAYQMYQELLNIVRTADQVDDNASESTDTSVPQGKVYEANMPVVMEESAENFHSFDQKKKKPKLDRDDSFDAVLDQVLEENKAEGNEEFSDDDDDLDADRDAVNPLKDFTFVGDSNLMGARPKRSKPNKLDSIATIRDYLETELGQDRLYQAYPVLRDFGDDILFEEKTQELIEKLEFVMTEEQVHKYRNFFALLIFHDMTVD